MDINSDLDEPPMKRFLTEEEITNYKSVVQGSGTVKAKLREVTRFQEYISERGVTECITNISFKTLSQYLGSFIMDRFKMEDGLELDTTTLHAVCSRLAVAISDSIGVNICKHQDLNFPHSQTDQIKDVQANFR